MKEKQKITLFMDYGGKALREELAQKPVLLKDCDMVKARAGHMQEKLCVATAYLSQKDCEKAESWALEVFHENNYYDGIEPVLDLLGIFQHTGECINAHHGHEL